MAGEGVQHISCASPADAEHSSNCPASQFEPIADTSHFITTGYGDEVLPDRFCDQPRLEKPYWPAAVAALLVSEGAAAA